MEATGGPGGAALAHGEVRERSLAWKSCHSPLLPWLQVFWGPLVVRSSCLWKKKGGEGEEGLGMLWEGECSRPGSYILRAFSLLQSGTSGRSLSLSLDVLVD